MFIVIILLLIVIIYLYIYKNNINYFDVNIGSIESVFDKCGGFFSLLGFKLNHYIYAKKHELDFTMSIDNWSYTISQGWTDYFKPIEIKYSKNTGKQHYKIKDCHVILEDYPLEEYKKAIPEIYRYNDNTLDIINKKIIELGLDTKEYSGIYIRRGDKLVDETNYTEANIFVDKLFEKKPDCKTIFIQTDDYNSVLDIKKYVYNKLNKYDIEILTLCPSTSFGSIANNDYYNKMINQSIVDEENKKYINKINNNLSKPISELNMAERYLHTIELLTSIDILLHAQIVICDFDSNISRFIKLAHNFIDNVYDVHDRFQNLDLSKIICPSNSF